MTTQATKDCSCTIRQAGSRYEVRVLDRACPAHREAAGQPATAPACVCAERGYCADVAGDPLACPACTPLGYDEPCPAERGEPVVDVDPAARVDTLAAVALASIRSDGDPAPALGRAPVEAMRHASLWHERGELRVYVDGDGDGFTLDDARRLRFQLDHLLGRAEVLQRSR